MRILVTGANGYLGQGIIKLLLGQGIEVIAADITVEHVDMRAERKQGDLFTVENPYYYFENPDMVLHLAWRDGFEHYSMRHITELPKHYIFLQKLIEGGIKKVCVLGSMHEIGFHEGSIDENTATNPQSLYGISKNALRQSISILQKKYPFLLQWIRGFYIVGNVEHGSSVFSKLAQAEKRGETYFPFTKGNNQFDFIDYSEFCKQVTAVVMQNKINGIINCCSGNPMRLAERVEQFIAENHFNIKLQYGAFPERPYDSKAVWGNDQKIREIMEKSVFTG
ncbi:NAD-dependent epimerase/dehydratase family protein [Dorea formicigenerans]|uniref:dTDP-6-deoxy-L-talose 4-dehydrogenase (NAD(+)) n=1 Tax=Dorea formicigenerans TaxID=39486 RepID=A0A564TWM7_9FIRM|nr:NAD(P)-dependent oxidoreductase [Dorea formicigenerans]VUX11616.1 dTDP-6-deoxy-L-talose 4-dehydrogenase (NAD(+)) [Dorea formicigenerans]